jgi:hypothetical protein
MPIRSDEDLERVVRDLRQLVGVEGRFCVDVLYVTDQLIELGLISKLDRVPDHDMEEDDASFDSKTCILRVKESVFHALHAPGNSSVVERQSARFTLAHEFCHVVQEPSGGVRYRGTSGDLAEEHDVGTRLNEIEANRFAAAFLVPDNLADAGAPAEDIADLFDVNLRTARIRKPQLERLQRRATGKTRALPESIVELLKEAKKKGYSVRSLDAEIERQREEAISNGFEGVECRACGEFKLRRSQGLLQCTACSSTQQPET